MYERALAIIELWKLILLMATGVVGISLLIYFIVYPKDENAARLNQK